MLRGVLAIATCLTALSACAAPSSFHDPPAPVLGLGGGAPYVRLTPPATTASAGAPLVYVAGTRDGTVRVIDPRKYRLVGSVRVGGRPLFVIPSWDLRTLWVVSRRGLAPIDPRTGQVGRVIPVPAANLLFTPNGRRALVITGRPPRIDLREPNTMRLLRSVSLPCRLAGASVAADGALVAACARHVIRVDLRHARVTLIRRLSPRARPKDVKLAPDGGFFVSDPARGGVWTLDARILRPTGFIPTGAGARSLIPSPDGTILYVTNRAAGTLSLIHVPTRQVIGRWRLPLGTFPTTGSVSTDGRVLWLSDHRHNAVYAISTTTGRRTHTIAAGPGPHGVCFFSPFFSRPLPRR